MQRLTLVPAAWSAALALCVTLASGTALAAPPAADREVRPISAPFDTLRLAGSFDVELVQGEAPSVTLEGDPRLIRHILTQVREGTLEVRYDAVHLALFSSSEMHVVVTAPALHTIRSEGSSDLKSGRWEAPSDLRLVLLGSGDVQMDGLSVQRIVVQMSGSGDVALSGKAAEQEVRISGAGDYEAENLQTERSSVSVTGAAEVVLWTTQSLAVALAGMGEVRYYGHPLVTRSVAGLGDIEALGDKP